MKLADFRGMSWKAFTAYCQDNSHVIALGEDDELRKAVVSCSTIKNPEAMAACVLATMFVRERGHGKGLYLAHQIQEELLKTTKAPRDVIEEVRNLHYWIAYAWRPIMPADRWMMSVEVKMPRARWKREGIANILLHQCVGESMLYGSTCEKIAASAIVNYLRFLDARPKRHHPA